MSCYDEPPPTATASTDAAGPPTRRADHGRAAGGAGSARNRAVGAHGERVAARALADAGLVVVDHNWRCEHGEIDLVAVQPGHAHRGLLADARGVVVCEVKTRTSTRFGEPAHQITARKAARLRELAHCWLAEHPQLRGRGVRVDVVGVLLPRTGPAQVTHLVGVDR